MKYAKKMIVVPLNQTSVGSSAQQHDLNMTVALAKKIPKNEKNYQYRQALAKLRELSDTLNEGDKFKETIS